MCIVGINRIRTKIFRTELPVQNLDLIYDYLKLQFPQQSGLVGTVGMDTTGGNPLPRSGYLTNTVNFLQDPAVESASLQEYHDYIRHISRILNRINRSSKFNFLLIISSGCFAGLLNQYLGTQCQEILLNIITADLKTMRTPEIMQQLQHMINLPIQYQQFH